MGVWYSLINNTKKECLHFTHLSSAKARELAGSAVTSAIVTWYLLQNSGDEIAFVTDAYSDWPFKTGKKEDTYNYKEVTDKVIDDLIANKILLDEGKEVFDASEPTVYIRKLKHIWDCVDHA